MSSAALKKRTPLSVPPPDPEADWYLWTQHQALALREGRFADLDLETLIEEVETLGRSDKHAIASRLGVLLVHLLKWRYQADKRSTSWAGTINEQRTKIAKRLKESPSLHAYPAEVFAEEYLDAREQAALETGLDVSVFPETSPFSVEDVLQKNFLL